VLIVVLVVLNNIFEIVSMIVICTRQKKSHWNVDLNICAQTGHSVSGSEHKHVLELSSPVIANKNDKFYSEHVDYTLKTIFLSSLEVLVLLVLPKMIKILWYSKHD